METQAELKKGKDRSPPFPFIPLTKALERARSFYAEEKRGAAPLSRAAMHWGYSPTSSGGLQTAAALKHYGLLDDVGGSGSDRQLRLTELALRILLDARPESAERQGFVRQAALAPVVSQEVHERWPEGLPSDGTLHHYLVLDRKFNEATALSAIKTLRENQALIGDIQVPSVSQSEDPKQDMSEKLIQEDTASVNADLSQGVHPARKLGGEVELALRHRGTTIVLRFSEEPTRDIFEYLERYCAFEKENAPVRPSGHGT